MIGKVTKDSNGILYVEYLVEGAESDEVQKEKARIAFYDRNKVSPGEEVEFEFNGFYTIGNKQVAQIKTK